MKINNKVSYTSIDGNTVIEITDENEQLMLDAVGTNIWTLILELDSIEDVIKKLQNDYPGYEEQIQVDVNEFVKILRERGIIDV